jgi:hypothetical protein
MAVMNPGVVVHYRRRAHSFQHAARDLDDLERNAHAPAIGLLSVHGCIAMADAIIVALSGQRTAGDDHRDAARTLREWCSAKRIEDAAVKHFEWLLGMKNHFSYDDRVVRDEDCWAAKVKMEQFFAWAFRTFPEVAQIPETKDA